MVRQNKKSTVSTSEFERLAKEFIGSTLDMSEQCFRIEKVKGTARAAIPHAAMSVLYTVKTFLALVKQGENDE